MKLSIIVPVYNVEKYLDKCVESILGQTFTDFELILVDDGATDNSGRMCDAWAAKDGRIVVIHKENGGLSDARNAGIDIAKGEYIGLVDSDDYIKRDMFEVLVTNLEQYHADLSMCGYADVYANGIRKENDDRKVYVWNQEETVRQILLGRFQSVHAVTKLYSRKCFESARYPKGKVSEDAFIIMDILQKVQTAVCTPYTGYYYVHRGESIKTGRYSKRDLDRIEAHRNNYNRIRVQMPQLEKLAYERYLGAVAFVAGKMAFDGIHENNPDCRRLYTLLRRNAVRILKAEYFTRTRKASIILMLFNKKMYAFLAGKWNQVV